MKSTFNYGEDYLTAGIAIKIANGEILGTINETAKEKIINSRKAVEKIANGTAAVYGINTGFGPLCDTQITPEQTVELQYNILKSHAVGVGKPIPKQIAKLMLILKIHALAKGFSGIQLSTLERINWHIENDVIPAVPEQGSVGASGDLAPLAHLFLPLIGLGKVYHNNSLINTSELFENQNLKPIKISAKEGLALINGTQFIAAFAVKVVEELHSCLSQADAIAALMIEGLLGSDAPFLKEIQNLRPFLGTKHVAEKVRKLLENSEIVESHKNCDRVQDPYSLRCIAQVHGSSRNAWLHLKEMLEVELNSVTDNPIIINENFTISGGNFHGQPLALPLDYACLAAAEIGNISDRRTYLSLTGIANNVPRLLIQDSGINSGFMMTQYTAAALVSENKGLCFPASADSIVTSLGQEDHVSMGSISGRKALNVIQNLKKILAIEMVHAAQAFDFHKPLKSSAVLEKLHQTIRSKIAFTTKDRIFANDINAACEIIESKIVLEIIEDQDLEFYNEFETF